jgi:hypothetical protein
MRPKSWLEASRSMDQLPSRRRASWWRAVPLATWAVISRKALCHVGGGFT